MSSFDEHEAEQAAITARYEALTKIGSLAHEYGAEIETCEDDAAALAYLGEYEMTSPEDQAIYDAALSEGEGEEEEESTCAPGGLRSYLVGVCELDGAGRPVGTHHVSSHVAENVEDAAKAGINETACDWCHDDESTLHVLFVMAAQVAGPGALPEIDVLEYDERA